MDENELRELSETNSHPFEHETSHVTELRLRIGRVISHIYSETRNKMKDAETLSNLDVTVFGDKMNLHKRPGLVNSYSTIIANQERNAKILSWVVRVVSGVVIAVCGDICVRLLPLIYHHTP